MQMITGSVGEGGANAGADAALVQAMLVKITRPVVPGQPAGPYLANYDGDCGPMTKKAIRAFQNDNVFVSAAGNQSAPNPNATAGLVKPNDATWTKLLAKVPAEFANLRALPGGKIVYVQADNGDLQNKLTTVEGMTFAPAFRMKVRACINRMYDLHGIAVGVCPQGDRRTFQAQYNLTLQVPPVTGAGPGESNHNYGMAADIGFGGLRWLHANGAIDVAETPWLHHLQAQSNAQALLFWGALRTVGTSPAVVAFPGPADDRPHLQNWNDANVSMVARLAAHLQASGSMHWSFAQASYRSDLGLGGAQYRVGRATEIWNNSATLTLADLNLARAAAATAQGQPAPPAATQQDLTAMRQALRHEFDLADANWQNWTAQ